MEREYYVWDKEGEECESWKKFYYFSESYRKSFIILLDEQIKNSNMGENYHDEEILPVLMNFFQYLELIFKSLLIKANLPIKDTIGHEPTYLYEKVKTLYSDFKLSDNIEIFIQDLEKISKFGGALRYPTDQNGKNSWVHSLEGRCFLLSGVSNTTKQTMGEIYNYLKLKIFI